MAFFRVAESRRRFPVQTIKCHRWIGVRRVRVCRGRWFTLPDVLDRQQAALDDGDDANRQAGAPAC